MTRRAAARTAWSVWVVSTALAIAGLALLVLSRSVHAPSAEYGFRGFSALIGVTFGTVGAVVASRRPENPIGWVFCWAGFSNALQLLAQQYGSYGLHVHQGSIPFPELGAWLDSWLYVPGTIGVLPFLFVLFPDGRTSSSRWRRLLWAVLIAIPIMTASKAFSSGPLEHLAIDNPLGIGGFGGRLVRAGGLAEVVVQGGIILSIVAFTLRFRRSRGSERKQFKWLAAAGILVFLSFVVFLAGAGGLLPSTWRKVLETLTIVAICTVPLTVGIAILRYRLYEIDRVISRTISYALVTAVLGGTFALFVLVPTLFVGGSPDWVVAGATLLVAALFRPVRWRTQNAVDHRFNRARYDAEHIIEAFTVRLREQIDIDALGAELRTIVSRTMQPSTTSLWLRPGKSS